MMRKPALQITLLLLITLCSAHAAYALTELGNNPFCSSCVNSAADVKTMLMENENDINEGLRKAGQPELFEPLYLQLPDAEITPVQYQKGQRLAWMFYRKEGKGKVRVDKDVVWEADEPLKSYEFFIDYNGQRYTMTVPPICANLALVGVGPIPVPAAPVAPVAPPAAAEGESAAGSPGTGAAPQVAETQVDDAKRLPLLFDLGYLHQLDPGHYVLVRVGLEHYFTDTFSVIGMIGVAPQVSGSDGETAFVADLFGNYNFSRFYIGLGLGAWLTDGDSDNDAEDSDLDIILNMGARLFGEPDSFNTSLFFEARSAVDEFDEFDYYGRFGLGLRFRF